MGKEQSPFPNGERRRLLSKRYGRRVAGGIGAPNMFHQVSMMEYTSLTNLKTTMNGRGANRKRKMGFVAANAISKELERKVGTKR